MERHNLYTQIFRQLRGYFISPHLNVWKGLRKRLFNDGFPDNISQLKDFTEAPPPELFDRVLESHQQMQLQSKFSELTHLEERPEEGTFESVIARIRKEKSTRPAVIRSIPFYKKMIAAAAFVIVLISCFFLLKTTDFKKDESNQPVVNNTTAPITDSLVKADSLSNTLPPNKLMVKRNLEGIKSRRYYFNATNHLSFNNASIDGNTIAIEENDLLYSFTNYPYQYGQVNPWNEKKGTVIKINEFTDINISPYMSVVISDLYKVKKNGRATFKAKRAKAKINKWRKTDVKRFDKKKDNNPLDIIDLGENVY